MKFSIIVAFGIAIFCCFGTDNVEAQEKTCKSIVADLTKRQLGGISVCTKALKFKNGKDKAKKMNCILKCILINEKVLTSEGHMTKENIDTFMLKEFPESLMEKANSTFTPCAEKAYGKLEPSAAADEFCTSYDGLIKCLLGRLPSLCA